MKMKKLCIAIYLIAGFALWTIFIYFFDVRAIGPEGSFVGLATLNDFVHNLTGVNMFLYTLTDYLGIIPIIIALGFGFLGFVQLVRRKSLLKVDNSILILGVFYIVIIIFYIFFELVIINYRPILIEGCLEASYPSSTTFLVVSVMSTAILQLNARINNSILRFWIIISIIFFIIFMVTCRVLSGVHWISDIIGGLLLSSGLVIFYDALTNMINKE